MRLSPAELSAIRSTLSALDPLGRVYLFGSRADDQRRGGDIDVFLEASHEIDQRTALTAEYRLHSACDCKVDLLIKTPGQADQPIHQIARKGIPL
jgi:predicted nucleotidyltransferase